MIIQNITPGPPIDTAAADPDWQTAHYPKEPPQRGSRTPWPQSAEPHSVLQ